MNNASMKPRAIYSALKAGSITEIKIDGVWYPVDDSSLSLIGSRNWTIRAAGHDAINTGGGVLARCSGNTAFEVR